MFCICVCLCVSRLHSHSPGARAHGSRPVPTCAYISLHYIALLQVNGQKVRGDEAGLGETVGLISRSPGPVEIKLRRGGEEIIKRVTPRVNADTGRASIGVQMAAHIEVRNRRKALFVVLGW